MIFLKLREHKEYIQEAASWFQSKWDIPKEEYLKSMYESLLKGTTIPQWYIMLKDNSIIGGLGVIENDFHDRKDLTPNICALYVNEKYRRQGIAGHMLKQVCDDMKSLGVKRLYLVTEHTEFYEKYDWSFLCMVQEENEPNTLRMYSINLD
ncbi:GNAT family N-acetyltransferase [Xylanibacter rarus]|uniref:N-acetyltransferase domain-containing protein n=1 Tax=Xylanibacter rarus TaxID=1676614 RepID=A0A8E1QW50_9BACT|nr:GNAT family N-acetyltransferase [Xylanibacter rarus]KOO67061.1 hypothetical protein ACU52_13395 [Xylanibacter rarus]